MPNRSLDDFAAGATEDEEEAVTSDADPEPSEEAEAGETAEAAETTDTGASDDESDDEADEPKLTVEEATPTYDFSPDGATCEACAETVEVRWHDPEAGMVCGDCKRWD